MTAEHYRKMTEPFRRHPRAIGALRKINIGLPLVAYIVYPLALLLLLLQRDERVVRVALVPALTFVSCTVFRERMNRPRPYENPDYHALLPREKRGASFPSRHTVASGIISAALWYLSPPLGILMTGITLLIAVGRVLAGVHHPSDVLVGLLIAAVCGYFGFFA